MSAARQRALATFKTLTIRWDNPSAVIGLVFGVLVEVERVRPIVDAAQAVVDAKSGQQLADARNALIDAVYAARKELAS